MPASAFVTKSNLLQIFRFRVLFLTKQKLEFQTRTVRISRSCLSTCRFITPYKTTRKSFEENILLISYEYERNCLSPHFYGLLSADDCLQLDRKYHTLSVTRAIVRW